MDNLKELSLIINKRRNRVLDRQGWFSLITRIAFLALIGFVLFTQVFLINQISGNGMYPAIKDGALVFSFRIGKDFIKNDCVVYTVNGKDYIGRVVAKEFDIVILDESGTLLVNGTAQSGEIMYPTYPKDGVTYPYEVPKGHVFILGDYRTKTEDSRDFGSIPVKDVKSKIFTILRRRGL